MAKFPDLPKLPSTQQPVDNAPVVPDVAEAVKTHTKWQALEDAKLVPTTITCSGYRPYHRVDLSCHTRLRLDAENVKSHIDAGHGGGFLFKLRKGDKPWIGWKKFSDLNLEAMDFRCEICDAQVPFQALHILKHMRPHSGKSRKVLPGGLYDLTINIGLPTPTEEEAFLDVE